MNHHQLAFERRFRKERVAAAVNSEEAETHIEVSVLAGSETGGLHTAVDMFQPNNILPPCGSAFLWLE